MRDRKIRKILYDKPYLLDGLFMRSRFEAQQMVLASTLTIEQVLQPIRQNSDIPETTWKRVDLALKAKERKDHYRATIKERFGDLYRGVKTHRRKLAVAVAIIIVFAFFTLIPSGRTLAKGGVDYFMNVFENHIDIKPTGQGPMHPGSYVEYEDAHGETVNEYGDLIIHYGDLESFAAEYGTTPVRLTSDDFICTEITLTKYATSGTSLTSSYSSSGGVIVITQEWLADGGTSFHSNSDSWKSVTILDGVELLYAVDKFDGIFDEVAMLPDSVLWISAQKSVDILEQLPKIGY